MFERLLGFILSPWHKYQLKKKQKARLEELRKRDPFIYK